MAVTANYSLQFMLETLRKEHDIEDDTIKAALMNTTFSFDEIYHKAWDATAWAASTAYSVGDIVKPTTENGYLYRCTSAGTSDSSEPTWPDPGDSDDFGDTVVDNGATWEAWSYNTSEDEISAGNGYTAGGQAVSNISASLDTTNSEVDIAADNVTWTATGGAMATTGATIFWNDSHANDTVVKCIDYGADYDTAEDKLFQVNFSSGFGTVDNE